MVLTRYVELLAGDPAGWKRLGIAMAALGSSGEAVESFLRAGDLYEARGQSQWALEVYCRAMELAPTEPQTKQRLQTLNVHCPTQ